MIPAVDCGKKNLALSVSFHFEFDKGLAYCHRYWDPDRIRQWNTDVKSPGFPFVSNGYYKILMRCWFGAMHGRPEYRAKVEAIFG